MTDRKPAKAHKLSYEILGLIGISAFFAVLLFLLLSRIGGAVAESWCFANDVILSEFEWLELDRWIFSLSGILSALGFSLLFLALFSDRIAYIRTITAGIDALRKGQADGKLPLEGRNELTQLAGAINDMAAAHQRLREKEQALAKEKEQFIRTLSHDIRTPLTSILAYSEFLASDDSLSEPERKDHLQMLHRKAEQIRDLTGLLLDAGERNPESFDNAHLLMAQLAAEFEEELEDRFTVSVDLTGCPAFAGTFDVRELRRIFDNLSSNARKYADPAEPVHLTIRADDGTLTVRQWNRVSGEPCQKDSYKLGIHSIRRIAQNYGGQVSVSQDEHEFSITVVFTDFL